MFYLFVCQLSRFSTYFFICTYLLFVSSCSPDTPPLSPDPKWPDTPLDIAILDYIKNPESETVQVILSTHFSDNTITDLGELVNNFGTEEIVRSVQLFPQNGLAEVIKTLGEDFFIMVLHHTVRSAEHLALLDGSFGLNKEKLLTSVLRTKSRYTGGLMVFQDIEPSHFEIVVKAFSKALPPGIFLHSFYKDPYLLASALKIIAQRDPRAESLSEFLILVPDNHRLSDLFTNDLPGFVVAFSTIQELSRGKNVSWASETLSITNEHLSQLILQKPANLAYILYGGHRIGINNFKQIIDDLGRDRFAVVLDKYSSWLANFLAGMQKITSLSTDVDFEEIKIADKRLIELYPYLIHYDSYLDPNWKQVERVFTNLPTSDQFLQSSDLPARTRVYLLALVSVYQKILQEKLPEAMLTPLQFDLLKQQIIYSTRLSDNLNNMLSNFEVGRAMIKDIHMETIVLLLAHELAHQIFSISGFDAPLLSSATIHECSADIGAQAVAEKLHYQTGIKEYEDKYVLVDDYSTDTTIEEIDLLRQQDPHKIGRTQLGFILQALENQNIDLDWGTLFSVNLSLLKDKTKMKHLSYIRDMVGGYVYTGSSGVNSQIRIRRFLKSYTHAYDTAQRGQSNQIAEVDRVEEMISFARTMMFQASGHEPNWRQSRIQGLPQPDHIFYEISK